MNLRRRERSYWKRKPPNWKGKPAASPMKSKNFPVRQLSEFCRAKRNGKSARVIIYSTCLTCVPSLISDPPPATNQYQLPKTTNALDRGFENHLPAGLTGDPLANKPGAGL